MNHTCRRPKLWRFFIETDIGRCILYLSGVLIVGVAVWLAVDTIRSADQIGPVIEETSQSMLSQQIATEQSRESTLIFDRLILVAVIVFGILGVHRLFMYICTDLDKLGHWNRTISRRRRKHSD